MDLAREERAGADDCLRTPHDFAGFYIIMNMIIAQKTKSKPMLTEANSADRSPGSVRAIMVEHEVVYTCSANVEVGIVVQNILHVPFVEFPVYLCSWTLHDTNR